MARQSIVFSTSFFCKECHFLAERVLVCLSGIYLHDKVLIAKCYLSLLKISFSFFAQRFVEQDRVVLYSIWLVTISCLFKVKFSRRPGI